MRTPGYFHRIKSEDGVLLSEHEGPIFYYNTRHAAPWRCNAWGLWRDFQGVVRVISSHCEEIHGPVFTTVRALHEWMGNSANPVTHIAARKPVKP